MAEQQNPNCLPPDARDQFPLHRFLGDQAHGPPRLPLRRLAANHGNDALLLRRIQQLLGAAALALVQGPLQTSLLVAMRNPPHGLWGQVNHPSHPRRRLPER